VDLDFFCQVCTVSPEARHGVESVSTLKFAQRASKVVTKAERGVLGNASDALIAKYEKELEDLRAQFERNQSLQKEDDGELEGERQKVRREREREGQKVSFAF